MDVSNATSVFRQTIENAEQSALGTENHASLEKTEQTIHSTLGPYTDWYLVGGTFIIVGLIITAFYFFKKKRVKVI